MSHSKGKAWFLHCLEISSVPPRDHTNKKKVKTYKRIFQENVAMKRKRQRTSSVWISKYKENLYKQTPISKNTSEVHSTGHEILGCSFHFGGNYWKKFLPALVEAVCVVWPGLQLTVGLTHTTPEPAGCSSFRRKPAQRRSCNSSELNQKSLLFFQATRTLPCAGHHPKHDTRASAGAGDHCAAPWGSLPWVQQPQQEAQHSCRGSVHLGALALCPQYFSLCFISSRSLI